MQIIRVTTKLDWNAFFDVPKVVYASDEEYIPHLRQDLESILKKGNALLKDGDCACWIVKDGDGLLGRVAAFYSRTKEKAGIGFFECVQNQDVADVLFVTAMKFLEASDKHLVEAPVNFGERDKYWGLMVKGFKRPSYQENYNPPYYQQLFENFGFKKEIVQTTQEISPETFNLSRFKPLAGRVLKNSEFEVKHMERQNLRKYARDFTSIYNQAWVTHKHFAPITEHQVLKTLQGIKPILREDLMWFTYAKGQPVAFYISLVDVNQIFKKLHGRFDWWGKLKFLWYKRIVKIDRIRGIIFGVVPEYQGKGLESGMIMKIFEVFKKDKNLKSSELAWVGDFNPKMLHLLTSLGAYETKVHFTFQKAIKKK